MGGHIFLSHASADATEVAGLRRVLEGHGRVVWVDTREIAAGADLPAELRDKIETADAFVVLLTASALKSRWVADELEYAKAVAAKTPGYRLIPLVVEPLSVEVLRFMFGTEHEPAAIPVQRTVGWAEGVALALLSALGEALLTGEPPAEAAPEVPLSELRIELERPALDEQDGKQRSVAEVRLFFKASDGSPEIGAPRAKFIAPLGPIEGEELRWYLERYPRWPYGVFRERARRVEEALPQWGQALLAGLTQRPQALEVLRAFRVTKGAPRISVRVEEALADDEPTVRQQAQEAAARLLSLPWELLHDEHGFLFMGQKGARVRRKLHFHEVREAVVTAPPLRILLVCPRPEDEQAAYIDHRASALPVVEAVETLGALAELTVLHPPTFSALVEEVSRAARAGRPYHVVHFDGHGVYDRQVGLGALCFESEATVGRIDGRATRLVHAKELAQLLRDHRVPLVVLEACQSAQTEKEITASVAGQLLQGGVASVVAMSHSVLVETARRFVAVFYKVLCEGQRVGEAMLRAQTALATDRFRGPRLRPNDNFELHDWFVPVLYQEDDDPRLVDAVPGATVRELVARCRQTSLGELPRALPRPHHFVGRSRELLKAERMLVHGRHVTLRGGGGEGKSTLAAELAHWLVRTRGFSRAALVAFDRLPMADRHGALQSLGDQLVADFAIQAGGDAVKAQQLVERALREEKVVLVFDNLETVLPSSEAHAADPQVAGELLTWIEALLQVGDTRAVLTTREAVPAPLDGRELPIGRMDRDEGIALVHDVLEGAGLSPGTGRETEGMLTALVEAVHGHARSLVLLAPEVARTGVHATTDELAALMRRLEQRNPNSRETSLLASVELSLRRLPEATRRRLGPLAVFEGGGQLAVIAQVLGLDAEKDEEVVLAQQLVAVGLAELLPYDYLRFDPALTAALAADLDDDSREAARTAWAAAMGRILRSLYAQLFRNAQIPATLASLDLANLLAVVQYAARTADPAEIVELADSLERLLVPLGRPSALVRIAATREQAARQLPEWSHATYRAASAAIERQLEDGRPAVEAARTLLRCAETAGEKAFPGAAYDLATCHFLLGRALLARDAHGEALKALAEAQRRYETLSAAGEEVAFMIAACHSERGDCLVELGQFKEAAMAYQETIRRATILGDQRSAAVGKVNLGSVRLRQRMLGNAIDAYKEALTTFTSLGEPVSVANAWHQLGIAYSRAGQFELAEDAFRSALKIASRLGHRPGKASTLAALGSLYADHGRHEEAVQCFRRATALGEADDNLRMEGFARNNAAASLIQLARLDEARRELERAIECKRPLGHVAEPWTTFALLADLENAAGDPAAAAAARSQARAAFLAYRRDDGENPGPGGHLTELIAEAFRSGDLTEANMALAALAQRPDVPPHLLPMLATLTDILHGSRDPALADSPSLNYRDAAEIELVLERLRTQP